MAMKQMLFGLLMVMSVGILQAEEADTALDDYAVLLCVAERNAIKFEWYMLDDLVQDSIVYLSKKERDRHCFLQIDMNEQGVRVIDATWNPSRPGFISVSTGKKTDPVLYDLDVLLPFDLSAQDYLDAYGICVECMVQEPYKEHVGDTEKWLCSACMEIPVARDTKECTLLFDKKLQSVCCVVLPASIFECSLRCAGRIKKNQAVQEGLLCCRQESLCHQDTEQQEEDCDCMFAQSVDQHAQAEETSFVQSVVNVMYSLAAYVANTISTSCGTLVSYVLARQ